MILGCVDLEKDSHIPIPSGNFNQYTEDNICFAYNDSEFGSIKLNHTVYSILYTGNLYNRKELKNELLSSGFSIDSDSETEIILKAFINWGYSLPKKLNGIYGFVIWNSSRKELFMVRDHFGIKPLYYTIQNDSIFFASRVNDLIKYSKISPEMNYNGICELMGIGPAHTPGTTLFSTIFEIKPAHFGIYNSYGFHAEKYWALQTKPHEDNLRQTCENISDLLEDAINKQMFSDKKVCTFLSGGLDSSIITYYASKYNTKHNLGPLNTYSVDYVDNDKNFVKNDFQPNSDKSYIDIMKKKLNTNHHTVMIDTPELADNLEAAMLARDFPGMADIDSSLLVFCDKVSKENNISLTGECADEVFAGYPWFFREDLANSNTFPWSTSYLSRQKFLNKDLSEKVDLKAYVDFRYNESLSSIDLSNSDSDETNAKKKITYLTLNWFMQTLIDRSERMASSANFEIRVPFCDYRLVQYVWNIPWEIKALNGREKGLLRYVMKDILPSEIIDRKKSPYPKTYNPTYLSRVKDMLSKIVNDSSSPIHNIVDKNEIQDLIDTDGKSFSFPWFGQLMTGPQLMAYFIQINMWLKKYNPIIKL